MEPRMSDLQQAAGGPLDAVDLAARVVQLVETGRRESTYKLATLMALIDICVEHSPAPDGTLRECLIWRVS